VLRKFFSSSPELTAAFFLVQLKNWSERRSDYALPVRFPLFRIRRINFASTHEQTSDLSIVAVPPNNLANVGFLSGYNLELQQLGLPVMPSTWPSRSSTSSSTLLSTLDVRMAFSPCFGGLLS
jgi:hypothetical protein